MNALKWVNIAAPLFDYSGVKLVTVPQGTVVEAYGWEESFVGVLREAVIYQTETHKYNGFIYTQYLEPYVELLPRDCVKISTPTPNPNDAEQYAIVHGVKQTNLCGELCAAYLLKVSLDDLLSEWQKDEPSLYQRVFNFFTDKHARGTGAGEVKTMLESFSRSAQFLMDSLRDPILKVPRYTVTALKQIAGRVIVGVKINKYTGRLQPTGVPHWVVVVDVHPERIGYGLVEVYNPFPNRVEVYSWQEFIASAVNPLGVVMDE